jgi:hypothetical protein
MARPPHGTDDMFKKLEIESRDERGIDLRPFVVQITPVTFMQHGQLIAYPPEPFGYPL